MPLILLSSIGFGAIRQNVIHQIRLQDAPQRIYLKLNQRSPYKIYQVDKKEIVIALKDVGISDSIEKRGSAVSFVHNLRIEHLQNNVTMLIIETAAAVSKADAKWDGSSSTLIVNFHVEKRKHKTSPSLKKKSKKQIILDLEVEGKQDHCYQNYGREPFR